MVESSLKVGLESINVECKRKVRKGEEALVTEVGLDATSFVVVVAKGKFSVREGVKMGDLCSDR
jgi:hypothetical protein